ncbi:MAG: hypothetical protein ACYDG6_06655 [Thermincolia bacterium]
MATKEHKGALEKIDHIFEQVASLENRQKNIVVNGPQLDYDLAIKLQQWRLNVLRWCMRTSAAEIAERLAQVTPRGYFANEQEFLEQCEYELLAYVLEVM